MGEGDVSTYPSKPKVTLFTDAPYWAALVYIEVSFRSFLTNETFLEQWCALAPFFSPSTLSSGKLLVIAVN